MRRALCSTIPSQIGQKIILSESEAKHLTQVLRLRPGDEIELLDGQGHAAKARLVFQDRGSDKSVGAEIITLPTTEPRLLSQPIHLYMSIIKGDAMEWVVEKAVELGVRQLTPVETEFTVVKVARKGADAFQERWQKIADQSLKQCGRLDRLKVEAIQTFEGVLLGHAKKSGALIPLFWLDEGLAAGGDPAHHLAHQNETGPVALWVGPEGGFSQTERLRLLELTSSEKKAIKRVHLGAPILRAETAALFGISLLYGKRQNSI